MMTGFKVQKLHKMAPASLAAVLFLRTQDWGTEASSAHLLSSPWALNLFCSKVLLPEVWLTDGSIGSLGNLLEMHILISKI